jgi:hypothetical protein
MYHITDYTKKKAKEIGVQIKPSTKKNKKIDVFRDGRLIVSVGDIRYYDYPTYLQEKGKEYADERRRLYHIRHHAKGLAEAMAKALLW